jgi:predicted kinase
MQRLFLIRGLPGTGKSTLGRQLAPGANHAADDYFVVGNEYRFDPTKLAAAHAFCQAQTRTSLKAGRAAVAVANTFTCRWELEPYFALARELQVKPIVIDLYDADLTDDVLARRNEHGVPMDTITAMRVRYERAWWDGDPRAPWERK